MTQMQALLTPYDTGERLEPRPWVQGGLNMAQLVRQSVGGISHDVVVDEIGVSLTGQRVAVDRTRRGGGEGTPAEGGQ
jgi:hypothetical protein